ncbi:MAG: methyl-accepting chemotaxis protein, partial [Magnetococcales bacterium]|nr:methyl-accepting chemotaxis protein [Magnetococcales bacterium]
MKNLLVRQRLFGLLISVILGFLLFGWVSWSALEELKVNGSLYLRIVQGKDLIADILPPPEYVLESYLVVLQISYAEDMATLNNLGERLTTLKKEYDDRHAFWLQESLEPRLQEIFLKQAHEPAQQFMDLALGNYLTAFKAKDKQTGLALLKQLAQIYDRHRAAIDQVVAYTNDRNARYEENAREVITRTRWTLLAIFFFSLGGVALLLWITTRWLLRTLGGEPSHILASIERLSSGQLIIDLTGVGIAGHIQQLATTLSGIIRQVSLQAHTTLAALQEQGKCNQDMERSAHQTDEQAKMAQQAILSLDRSVDSLQGNIQGVAEDAQSVAAAAEELSANVSTIAASSNRASHNVEQVATSTTAMTDSVAQVLQNVAYVNGSISTMSVAAEEMSGTLAEVRSRCQTTTMQAKTADHHSRQAGETIRALALTAQEIGEVVSSIQDIASQTNMLALNAAIEAAGAGESGKGFAVVANEVKELARQTADATQQITQRVEAIQKQVESAQAATNQASTVVGNVTELNQEILMAVEEQTRSTTEITHTIGQVSGSMAEVLFQAEGIKQSVISMAQAAQEAAQETREAAQAAFEGATASHQVAEGASRSNQRTEAMAQEALAIVQASGQVQKAMAKLSNQIQDLTYGVNNTLQLGGLVGEAAQELLASLAKFDAGKPIFNVGEVKQTYLARLQYLERLLQGQTDNSASPPMTTSLILPKNKDLPHALLQAVEICQEELTTILNQVKQICQQPGRTEVAHKEVIRFNQVRQILFI